MTATLVVLMLVAQAPSTPPPPAEGEPVRYRSEKATSDGQGNVLHLEGKAELRTDTARIEADKISYDQRTRVVTATGHCYAVQGLNGAVGDGLVLDLSGSWMQLQNGRFFEKTGIAPETMLQLSSAEELLAKGKTTLATRADRVERVAPGHLRVDGIDFTPCDCNPLEPHWSIKAFKADVYPGEQAWMYLPVVYIYGAPVLPFPVMDVPLKSQKTGLLFTTPNHTAQNGWQVSQPVYFALAPNFDLTATPGYVWGASGEDSHPAGIRGPNFDTEVRWTHSRESRGDLELFVFDDLKPIRDPRSLAYYPNIEAGTPTLDDKRGFRGSLNGFVAQALGGPWSARVDVNLVSDSAVVKDTVTDVAQQANQYLRSSAVISRRTDDSLLTIEATAQQDTYWGGFTVFDSDRWPYPLTGLDPHQDNSPFQAPAYPYGGQNRGQWLRGPATLQKLPDVRLSLPWRTLGDHFSWTVAAGFARLAPFSGHSGDEGIDGLYQQPNPPNSVPIVATRCGDPGAPPPCQLPQYQFPQYVDTLTQGDRIWQPGEREARMRLDLVPRLSATFALGDWLRIRPTIWIRQDAYLGEVTHNLDQRGYAVGDVLLSSEISRTFANGLRHAIQPSFEYRAIPGQWGAVPGNAPTGPNQPVENRFYDEIDGAVMKTPLSQGVAHLTQTLSRRTGAVMQELLRIDVAQEFDFIQANGLSDFVVSLRTGYAPFSGGITFRYDTQRNAPALWAVFAGVNTPRFGVNARLDQIYVPAQFYDRDVGPDFLTSGARNLPATAISGEDLARFGGGSTFRQGIDELVGSPVPANLTVGQRQTAITLDARVNLVFGLGLTYSGTFYPSATWTRRNANGDFVNEAGTGPPPGGTPLTGKYSVFGQQSAGISFAPACNCWRLDVIGRLPPPGGQYVQPSPGVFEVSTFQWRFPDILFLLTIQNFGTFGAGG